MRGYSACKLSEDFAVSKTFGVGTFLSPSILVLSLAAFFFPYVLLIVTSESGFPDLVVFGFQVTFMPMQITGLVLHFALGFIGIVICRKFRSRHHGASWCLAAYKIILVDLTSRLLSYIIAALIFVYGVSAIIRTTLS